MVRPELRRRDSFLFPIRGVVIAISSQPPRQPRDYDRESKYIIDEQPTSFSPSLADIFGVDEAIFVQQIHFWMSNPFAFAVEDNDEGEPVILPTVKINGQRYVRVQYEQMTEDTRGRLRFYSEATLKRIVHFLKKEGYLLVESLDKDPRNRTNWYSLNYAAIRNRERSYDQGKSLVRLSKPNGRKGNMEDQNELLQKRRTMRSRIAD